MSVHGSNRLGTNSLLDINVFGRRAGIAAAEYAARRRPQPELPENRSRAGHGAWSSGCCTSTGAERVAAIRRELQDHDGRQRPVLPDRGVAGKPPSRHRRAQARYPHDRDHDKGKRYNSDLLEAIELGFLLDLAEVWWSSRPGPQRVARRPLPRGLPQPRRRQLHAAHDGLPREGRGPAESIRSTTSRSSRPATSRWSESTDEHRVRRRTRRARPDRRATDRRAPDRRHGADPPLQPGGPAAAAWVDYQVPTQPHRPRAQPAAQDQVGAGRHADLPPLVRATASAARTRCGSTASTGWPARCW